MKGRIIAVEQRGTLTLAALVIDGQIKAVEVDDRTASTAQPGAIFMAKVTDMRPDMGAAFLDLGGETAFLPDASQAKPGALLPVRITRAAESAKHARASDDLQLTGRYMVHTPDKPGINVSRKLSEEERKRLTDILLPFQSKGGFVIRTHAAGVSEDLLTQDAHSLSDRLSSKPEQPGLIALALEAAERCQRIACASGEAAQIIADGFETLDLYARIDELLSPEEPLSEGSMRIEKTAAAVMVDVNTGQGRGGDVLGRVNLAAAASLPDALRLRHLGGTVLIDFAGTPREGGARRRLEKALSQAAANMEGFRPLGWGPAGLYEFRTMRPANSLAELLKGQFDG